MSDGRPWRFETNGAGRVTLWFDRPGPSQNSLDEGSFRSLDDHLIAIAGDPSVTGVVLRSAKPKGFCAGADLKALAACPDAVAVETFLRIGWATLDRLASLSVPTIAVIHGVCLGGGLELALACRYRLAIADDALARIGTPEVLLGLIPGWGAIAELPRLIGWGPSLPILLGGQPVDARIARQIGLIDEIASDDGIEGAMDMLLRSPDDRPTGQDGPPTDWATLLSDARGRMPDAEPGPTHARHRLLDVLEVECDKGPAAGREAAIRALTELAVTPEARLALDAFARRPTAAKS